MLLRSPLSLARMAECAHCPTPHCDLISSRKHSTPSSHLCTGKVTSERLPNLQHHKVRPGVQCPPQRSSTRTGQHHIDTSILNNQRNSWKFTNRSSSRIKESCLPPSSLAFGLWSVPRRLKRGGACVDPWHQDPLASVLHCVSRDLWTILQP